MKLLVAGFGNVLREDDAFGIELLRRLEDRVDELPPGTVLLEAGIGGISLVQELTSGYDAVIVLDAVEGDTPGAVETLALEVRDPARLDPVDARQYFADIHYAEPGRALALARGVGSLPDDVYMVGCVPLRCDVGEGLSPRVHAALEGAADSVVQLSSRLLDEHEERRSAWSRSQSAPTPSTNPRC